MNFRKPLLVTAASVVILFAAFNARAYYLEGPKWQNVSTVTFQSALGNAGRTLLDGNTSWDVAIAPVPGTWNQSIANLRLISTTNPSAPTISGDGVNSIFFSTTAFGHAFGSYTLAVTQYYYSGSRMIEADVAVNSRQSFDSYRGPLRFGSGGSAIADIRRVMIHELGHAIGLDHPDSHGQHVTAVMNSVISNTDTTASDDIAGAQTLYGVSNATPTPTPTPSPTATPTPSPTATPTPTPSPTPSPTPTPDPSPTPTPSPTATPTPSPTPASTPAVSVSAAPTSIRTGDSATYTVTASTIDPNNPVTVNFVMSGSAIQGKHYSLSSSGNVTIPAGASSANITLNAIFMGNVPKTATLTLTWGSGYNLSSSKAATVTISK
jgi:hypothetical protein